MTTKTEGRKRKRSPRSVYEDENARGEKKTVVMELS